MSTNTQRRLAALAVVAAALFLLLLEPSATLGVGFSWWVFRRLAS